MSKPAPGNYIIYNRVLGHTGQKLAITFTGQDKPATVTPLSYTNEQIWTVKDYSDGKTQHVIPTKATNLEVGWGGTGAVVLPAGSYVWTIRPSEYGFTIQDGGVTQNWGIEDAFVDSKVSITKDTGHPRQRWILEKLA